METPIDFGKNFLYTFFKKRDAEEALTYLADDVIWITPDTIEHLRDVKEILQFLTRQIENDPRKYTVDIAAIKSAPVSGDTNTIVYDVNLIPYEEETSVNLRCSLALHKASSGYELVFVGMSRKYLRTDPEVIRGFIDDIPAGLLVLACIGANNTSVLYSNSYLYKKIGISEGLFGDKLRENPFFMVSYKDQRRLSTVISQLTSLKKPRPMPLQVTVIKNNNKSVPFHTVSSAAYRDGDRTVIYVLFNEISDLVTDMQRQMKRELRAGSKNQVAKLLEKDELDATSEEATRAALVMLQEKVQKKLEKAQENARIDLEKEQARSLKLLQEQKDRDEAVLKAQKEEQEQALASQKEAAAEKYLALEKRTAEKLARQKEEDQEKITALQAELEALRKEKEDLLARMKESEDKAKERETSLTKEIQDTKEYAEAELSEVKKRLAERFEARARDHEVEKKDLEDQLRKAQANEKTSRLGFQEKSAAYESKIRSLEAQVHNQTAGLRSKENEKQVSLKEKDKSLQRMGQLLAGQMNRIRSLTETSREQSRSEAAKTIGKVNQIARTTPDMAGSIVKVAQIDPAARLQKEEDFQVAPCVECVRRVLWARCRRDGIVFTASAQQGTPNDVHGCRAGLMMALFTITENAVSYTAGGGKVNLEVYADAPVRGSAYFHFVVTDTGRGIPDDRMPELFADPSSELSIARRVISQMGGSIGVRSGESGSRFEITVNLTLGKE